MSRNPSAREHSAFGPQAGLAGLCWLAGTQAGAAIGGLGQKVQGTGGAERRGRLAQELQHGRSAAGTSAVAAGCALPACLRAGAITQAYTCGSTAWQLAAMGLGTDAMCAAGWWAVAVRP